MQKLSRYFPSNMQQKLMTQRNASINKSEVYIQLVDKETSMDECAAYSQLQNKKDKTEPDFMMVAKIKALEEYVEHIESVMRDQGAYILELEEKAYPKLERRFSV